MGMALLVWVGGGLLKWVLYLFRSKIGDPAPASIVTGVFSPLFINFVHTPNSCAISRPPPGTMSTLWPKSAKCSTQS